MTVQPPDNKNFWKNSADQKLAESIEGTFTGFITLHVAWRLQSCAFLGVIE